MALRDHAHAQIHILEETLARAGKTQRPLPFAYILWGLTGTFFNALFVTSDWIDAHFQALGNVGNGLTIASVLVTAYECRGAASRRRTALDRQAVQGAGPVRELMYGGCVLFAAVFLAAFEPPYAALIFAVGNFCALVVPGFFLLATRRAAGHG